eukprot:4601620-Amphidinium_carterae.1
MSCSWRVAFEPKKTCLRVEVSATPDRRAEELRGYSLEACHSKHKQSLISTLRCTGIICALDPLHRPRLTFHADWTA